MKIHKIYVVGKYRNPDKIQKKLNIAKAGMAAMELCQKGWLVFCPHLNTGGFDDACPEVSQEFWLALGSAFQRDCEAIYLLRGYESSKGSLLELQDARRWNQTIFIQGENEPPDLNLVVV